MSDVRMYSQVSCVRVWRARNMYRVLNRGGRISNPTSQLHLLLQHEQRWASVLGADDAQLQAAAVQPQHMQRLAQGNTGTVSVKGANTRPNLSCFCGGSILVQHVTHAPGC
jgi:hypothetical protein